MTELDVVGAILEGDEVTFMLKGPPIQSEFNWGLIRKGFNSKFKFEVCCNSK